MILGTSEEDRACTFLDWLFSLVSYSWGNVLLRLFLMVELDKADMFFG